MQPYPFIGAITSLIPGQELVALRQLDVDEDIFLRDHTLGGRVSVTDDGLMALPVVPLTISMEMLAEAAAVLLPDKTLVGIKDIRAYRWIALDEGRVTLQLIARRKATASEQEIEVQIKEFADPSSNNNKVHPGTPIIEGTVVFGDSYPAASQAGEFPLQSERPSKWTPEQLYAGVMFHGPSLQGVASVDRWGEDGTEGTLKALPTDSLFRSIPQPCFLIDPVLLDAAGQLVGYWAAEHLEKGFHVFPFRVEAVHIYGRNLCQGEFAKCQVRTAFIDEWQLRSDIDIIGPEGRLLTRLVGWWDRRFDLPDRFYRLRISPQEVLLSTAWPQPIARFPAPEAFRCCLLDELSYDFLGAHGKIWQRVLAHLVLSRQEREIWRSLKGPDRRRTEWLLGRVAAKDAVRLYLKDHYGIALSPADIEIAQDEHGQPQARGKWAEDLEKVPLVSLAHSSGMAIAVAGHDGQCHGIGIDIEHVGRQREGFEGAAFSPAEQHILSSLDAPTKEEWCLRLWCAKEAVAKAVGRGMTGGPLTLEVLDLDILTGCVSVVLTGELAKELPHFAGRRIVAYTARENDFVYASSLV
jgi:phosphopantetheine--protein transferase-like protein